MTYASFDKHALSKVTPHLLLTLHLLLALHLLPALHLMSYLKDLCNRPVPPCTSTTNPSRVRYRPDTTETGTNT